MAASGERLGLVQHLLAVILFFCLPVHFLDDAVGFLLCAGVNLPGFFPRFFQNFFPSCCNSLLRCRIKFAQDKEKHLGMAVCH